MELDLLFATPHYVIERIKREKAKIFCALLSGKVADVGCGFSPYRKYLTGISDYTAVETELRYRPNVIASATKLPFASESLDGVILTEVLEHLPEPAEALAEAKRVLKQQGLIYITVPLTWGLHYVPNDYYRFTHYGLSHLVRKEGFEVEKLEPMGGLFTIIYARLTDFFVTTLLDRPLKALGVEKGRLRICALVVAPLNLVFYYLSSLLDQLWQDDVFGWALIARKL